ncbi:MAG TPA: helix-turn-helix transcriptional regulator [Cellvibrio sp.]|nr:helix-turn-helix transcriptional regulator [Cellvibrio sp.]
MDMKINASLVKELRSQKSWSQDQLATISSLSLRTVQRIEKSGLCSLESRRALASAFDIDVTQLDPVQPQSNKSVFGGSLGYLGAGLGLAAAYVSISVSWASNHISSAQAGIYYGVVGVFIGVCCAVIGCLSKSAASKRVGH